jgi:beta-glucosidase
MDKARRSTPHSRFMFATGIDSSDPTIAGRNGRPKRVDEMEKCGHYRRWREDFALVKELGIDFLRYGPPYHIVQLGPGRYDWSFPDETFAEIRRLEITPIVDLCHFGVPDWLESFQNPGFPSAFAEYASAFAKRYPWVYLYTPVNEIFIAATFSASFGWWNERLASDRAFTTALRHLARANLLAEEAILESQQLAIFIQSESTEYFHAEKPRAEERADVQNQKRFLSLDLCYGYDVRGCMLEFLMANGMSLDEYHWFLEHGRNIKPHCIMGNDYYATNEHVVPEEGPFRPSGEILGYYLITKEYYDRYHLPVMHTETNLMNSDEAPRWLRKEWANMIRLRTDGVPIVGFTWYSLTDQVDWDSALLEDAGRTNPLGLYDLDRKIRPVGKEFRDLIEEWEAVLPAESICIRL